MVTTDLGNEFATLDRELPAEAVHRTKRPEDRNAIAVVDRGIQTLKKDLATRVARKGGQWSDHFERAAGAYNARPHETVHGAPDRPQHGGPGDPAEAGAAGAAGQRQRGGPADETQAGGCEAAGRLPGASEAQDPRLAFENDF